MNQKANFEDLLNNDFFIKWVKDKPSQSEWNTFIKESPLSEEEIQAARSIIEQVSKTISRTNSNNIKGDVWKNIESVTLPQKRYSKFWLGCLLLSLIIALSSVYILYVNSSKVENVIALDVSDQWITYTNTSESNWPIDLADGSQVVLEPYANLKYPRLFNSTSRKVELEGNAYFDITHDTLKPFYVYANEALIRVLGTSFYVKADEEDKDIKVIVETGKVAVYKGESVKNIKQRKLRS